VALFSLLRLSSCTASSRSTSLLWRAGVTNGNIHGVSSTFAGYFFYFPPPLVIFPRSLVISLPSSKIWVGFFRDFFLTKFNRKVFSFDSGRGSIAGPAWKSTADLNFDSITPWKRGRSGRLGSTRSQKHHRPPHVTRKRTRGRFLPLSVLRTRVARSFKCTVIQIF